MRHPQLPHLFRSAAWAAAAVAAFVTAAVQAAPLPVDVPSEFRFISSSGDDRSFGGAPPAVGWQDVGFDDSDAAGWSRARNAYPAPLSPPRPIPFGDPAEFLQAGYIWHDPSLTSDGTTGVDSAFFRRQFILPQVAGAFFPFEATLQLVADDDFEAWINGVMVISKADFGTMNDRGPDFVFSVDVTDFLRFGDANGFGQNVLAVHATDGALRNPVDFGYEHMAYQLRIRTVDEPGSMLMALTLLAAAGIGRRHYGPTRNQGEVH